MTDFKWRHFQGDVILWAVRWYCRYPISYRDLEEMLAERGISVDHTTIYRWVQCYAPEMEKRLRWFWRRGFDPSWRLDETYVKVRGKWTYLYRAVDKRGDTIDFYLSPTRSAKAAKRFLGKALRGLKHWEKPATLNTDKAPSYGAAITELKREGKLDRETAHRQVKYLNNVIEADHGKLNIMREAVIAEVSTQLSEVVGVIERHLEPTLLAVHLYGSAVDGGLKPHSDIDLLVTVTVRLDETTRRALINDLLETSASPGESEILRAVEVTIVVHDDIIPWRYPAKRELQFGEWQRNDILAGIFEPATIDIDLAILLTKAREHSVALVGPAAEELFDPVPEQDLFEALNETLTLWNSPPDWAGDERNVVLTLSRIWYSAVTGKIAPKDVAADWAMERLPAQYQPVILEARQAYLGQEEDRLASRADQLEEFVHYVKGEITKVVGK
ncbi:ANT(3'')-Ia family aminoglycoside nucleotidyltransferase AadA1 [Allopusillimonas soli]|nr:ANT(3'')-Ia family aminoglycoside nucleotidyltransferase AadA1 [Allopusillimonas soli]